MSLARKIKRNKLKKLNKHMKGALQLFDKLPGECLTCGEDFDKRDKKQVTSWSVVVREKEEKVNLYCPTCWNQAKELLKEMEEHLNEN